MSVEFCEHGCYWECDHRRRPHAGRPIAGMRNADPAALWDYYFAADDLRYCLECGKRFSDAVRHAKEHLQRQPERAGRG